MGFVSECPKTQTEVALASKRLGCGSDKYGNNQYICAPNDSKTSLVEMCMDGIMGIQNKGNCLAVTGKGITTHSCLSFSSGCPANHFWSSDFFQYPACQRINTQYRCYEMDPSCASKTHNDETGNTHIIGYICGGIGGLLVLIILVIILVILWKKAHHHSKKDIKDNVKDVNSSKNQSPEYNSLGKRIRDSSPCSKYSSVDRRIRASSSSSCTTLELNRLLDYRAYNIPDERIRDSSSCSAHNDLDNELPSTNSEYTSLGNRIRDSSPCSKYNSFGKRIRDPSSSSSTTFESNRLLDYRGKTFKKDLTQVQQKNK